LTGKGLLVISALPETFPALPETFPALPDTCPALPETCPALPETFPALPETFPALPETFPALPETFPALPETFPAFQEPLPFVVERLQGRASAFTFSTSKFLEKQHTLKKKIHREEDRYAVNQREEVEKVKEEREKRACEQKLIRLLRLRGCNFFQNLVISRNLKVNADALGCKGAWLPRPLPLCYANSL
jgi:hypothetical protein